MEKELQEKMQNREINPSPQAWDRLDAMLTVAEEQKRKPKYNWLLIAASLLGFLFLGAMLFKNSKVVVDAPMQQVVVNENAAGSDANAQQDSLTPVSEQAFATNDENTAPQTQPDPKSAAGSTQKIRNTAPATLLAAHDTQSSIKTNHQSTNSLEVVSSTPLPNQLNPAPEAPKLLAQAQAEPQQRTGIKVSASALLGQAEKEVQHSFRERMLRRASEVAEAVSERNIDQ